MPRGRRQKFQKFSFHSVPVSKSSVVVRVCVLCCVLEGFWQCACDVPARLARKGLLCCGRRCDRQHRWLIRVPPPALRNPSRADSTTKQVDLYYTAQGVDVVQNAILRWIPSVPVFFSPADTLKHGRSTQDWNTIHVEVTVAWRWTPCLVSSPRDGSLFMFDRTKLLYVQYAVSQLQNHHSTKSHPWHSILCEESW